MNESFERRLTGYWRPIPSGTMQHRWRRWSGVLGGMLSLMACGEINPNPATPAVAVDDGPGASNSVTEGAEAVAQDAADADMQVLESPGNKNLPPNVLILLADDLGFDDIRPGAEARPLETPNIDRLASESVRCDQFYVAPTCAPTRAGLLTGRHALSVGVWDVHGGRDFLAPDQKLLPAYLKDLGYRTGMMGKWHSGITSGYHPWQRGFDEAYVADLYTHLDNRMVHNGKELATQGPTSERLVDRALEFIDASLASKKPFFTYVPFLETHEPWVAPASLVKKYEAKGLSKSLSTLYGMIDQMDSQVGRLLNHLDKTGVANNTVVLFFSDNGPWTKSGTNGLSTLPGSADWKTRNPSGLRANKGEVYDNGIRSRLLVRYGKQYAPRDSHALLDVTDVLPTLLELAGGPIPAETQGKSFVPVLRSGDDTKLGDRVTFFAKHTIRNDGAEMPLGTTPDKTKLDWTEQILAARQTRYKLVRGYDRKFQLYDMLKDPKESTSIYGAASSMAVQTRLERVLEDWYKGILTSSGTLTFPVQFIGYAGESESILAARAPKSIQGKTSVLSWTTQGFGAAGDGFELALSVVTAGRYDVQIEYAPGSATQADVEVVIAGKTLERNFPVTDGRAAEGELRRVSFGDVELGSPGPTTLKLSVKSVSAGDVFSRLDRVILVRR